MESQTEAGKQKNQGGRPQKPLGEAELAKLFARPEVAAVMQGIISQAVAQVVPQAAAVAPVAPGGSDIERLATGFAMAAAKLADPRKKPMDPEEMQARQDARERMHTLIAEVVAKGETPEYELTRETYIEEQLIPATYIGADRVVRRQVIGYTRVPNQAMVPINDCAKAIFGEYLRSIGGKPVEGVMEPHERRGHLKVFSNGKLESVPVGRTRMEAGSLSLRGHSLPGQVIETNVLGSVHAPARQLA